MTIRAHNPSGVYELYANYSPRPFFDPANVPALLKNHLGADRAARTVVCARLLEPTWLIEVEAIAAKV